MSAVTSRRLLFECRVGSQLFGTATPESDADFCGVFMPAAAELLGLSTTPLEWNDSVPGPDKASTVDRKYYSVKRFLQLASQGQPNQLEMLWAPPLLCSFETPEWLRLKTACLGAVRWKGAIRPFLGFALAQAYKATVKGENLNLLSALLAEGSNLASPGRLSHHLNPGDPGKRALWGQQVEYYVNDHGYPQVKVAGRSYDPNISTKTFLESIKYLLARYGGRSAKAAEAGYDYKSLSHAVRLLGECEEFLLTGNLTLPRPNAAELLQIKRGLVQRDWFEYITGEMSRIEEEVVPRSELPSEPSQSHLEDLCVQLHLAALTEKSS